MKQDYRSALTSQNRHAARELALQALYELDCTTHPIEQVMQERLSENQIDEDVRIFTYQLINGVLENKSRLDTLIQQYATEWPLDQVAIIDRNILRIAFFEFAIVRDTPAKVIFNEAVELAKEFGADNAPRFVNGVLGALSDNETEARTQLEDTATE